MTLTTRITWIFGISDEDDEHVQINQPGLKLEITDSAQIEEQIKDAKRKDKR
eukprot:UN12295